jgi:ABC-2 type transport system permease protein
MIGYVVAALGLLICGILFQALALDDKARLSADVLAYFFQLISFYTGAVSVVLAIRLLAEERQQHTLVPLNTSPVRDVEIVVGKFLAAFVFMSLIVLASVYMPFLIKVRGKVSMEQIVVGYVGLLLMGSAVLAIGMFASSLTRHQLIAAAVALAIVFFMGNIYPLAKQLDPPLSGVLSDLDLWWVRFRGGFEKGILNLKDVIYYVAVTYFFLLLATKTMETKRWQ